MRYGFGILILVSIITLAAKKRDWNWAQGEVCSKSGLCLNDVHTDYEGNTIAGIFVNRIGLELHNCPFVSQVLIFL